MGQNTADNEVVQAMKKRTDSQHIYHFKNARRRFYLLIGDLIEMQFLGNSYNPNLGAAISLVLMVIILLIMTILNQFDDDEDKVLM